MIAVGLAFALAFDSPPLDAVKYRMISRSLQEKVARIDKQVHRAHARGLSKRAQLELEINDNAWPALREFYTPLVVDLARYVLRLPDGIYRPDR